MREYLINLVLFAVASGTLSLTITYSHLTKTLRHRYIDAPFMIGELINCPYCMAHWTAIPFAFMVGHGYVLINWLIIVGVSALFMGVLLKLFLFRESENEELRQLVSEAREVIEEMTK